MTEYISREAVLEILCGRSAPWDGYQKVKELPAADVRPVVRASWCYPTPYTAQYTNCGTLYTGFQNELHDCPLVPVPPHGRLIDADELDKIWGLIGHDDLEAAPTIIPAEEGEI